MRPALITAAACVLAAAAADPAAAASQPDQRSPASAVADAGDADPAPATTTLRPVGSLLSEIRWTRRHALRNARRAALPLPRHGHAERHAVTRADLVHILRRWDRRLEHYRRAYTHRRPIIDGLKCIHTYEGAWNAVSDTVPTYYGGLQMDASFEEAYGSDVLAHRGGHANRWPRHDQLMVGVRGYQVRGYTPWPTAAASCGLS